ncbi:hypothetical protein [Salinigranum halophilum]|jgi:hypothetical protein|uniref:hypothetical protein n=1 Tax=Salinigranum halophilum TaxID=2565931 RepID=UPI0010A796B6|nr:hypothetical protein [Salinigranum halophilum]
MKSAEHAAVGAVVGAVAVALFLPSESLSIQAALWAGGVFFSVFIDLDHFVIARAMRGDWSNLRRAVTNPRVGLVDQEQVFADVDEPRLRQYRLLSHLLLGGVLVALASRLTVGLGVFVAVLLYAHVVADLVRDAELA